MYVVDNSGRPKVMLEYEETANWAGALTPGVTAFSEVLAATARASIGSTSSGRSRDGFSPSGVVVKATLAPNRAGDGLFAGDRVTAF